VLYQQALHFVASGKVQGCIATMIAHIGVRAGLKQERRELKIICKTSGRVALCVAGVHVSSCGQQDTDDFCAV